MDKDTLQKKKNDIEVKFTNLGKDIQMLEVKILQLKEEQLRLSGEFRLLEELEKESTKVED